MPLDDPTTIAVADLEPRVRLALVTSIKAGEQFALIGVEEVDGADEVGGYLAALEENLATVLGLLRAAA